MTIRADKKKRKPPILKERPLYLMIAFWGLRTGKPLTEDVISREFLIPREVSRKEIYFIKNECNVFIEFEMLPYKGELGKCRPAMKIKHINDVPEYKVRSKDYNINANNTKINAFSSSKLTNFQKLRQWMCSRKKEEKVPQELIGRGK